jgi:hypothetical protein
MIIRRVEPTTAQLAASRLRNKVPADWAWTWCANPLCTQWVWYPPGAEDATVAGGLPFFVTCSEKCTVSVIKKLP